MAARWRPGFISAYLCVPLRSSAPLRLLLFTYTFTAEAQRNAEIRREDLKNEMRYSQQAESSAIRFPTVCRSSL